MLTRKHFELIAQALRAAKPVDDGEGPNVQAAREVAWEVCAEKMADALQAANPRFDRKIFYAACEG